MNGETHTADALTEMKDEQFTTARGDRVGARNVALVITDGVSTDGTPDPVAVAEDAMDEGVRVSQSSSYIVMYMYMYVNCLPFVKIVL